MVRNKIGIRREDKNIWEKRTPLTPVDVAKLVASHDLHCIVQPSADHRAFDDSDYASAGAIISEELSDADIILGIKEIPIPNLQPGKVHIFFAHVIKGQAYNMPLLRTIMEKKCTLIDYEKIEDAQHRRLIFFGRHAGLAGMVETLHTLGQKLLIEGCRNPFSTIDQPYRYASLREINLAISQVAGKITADGLPENIKPVVFAFTGYGNVSKGAQEIFDMLPHVQLSPEELLKNQNNLRSFGDRLIKVVFYEKDLVEPIDASRSFELQDYFKNPQYYRSRFHSFVPLLTGIVNCIYWTPLYPRLVTNSLLKDLSFASKLRLKVIGDISCDIDGSIEATVKSTSVDNPVFVYNPLTGESKDGVGGYGPAIMSIDNLPCEIPRDASKDFSSVLSGFVPELMKADFSKKFEDLDLSEELKGAVITLQGKLTEKYSYISRFL